MNVDTGKLYTSIEEALIAGEERDDLVEVFGTPEQVEKVSEAVRWTRAEAAKKKKAKRKQVKKSRRAHRR